MMAIYGGAPAANATASPKKKSRNNKRPKADPNARYPCPVCCGIRTCEKIFTKVANLKQHITQVHLGRCRICYRSLNDTMFKKDPLDIPEGMFLTKKGNVFDDKNVEHVERLRSLHINGRYCPGRIDESVRGKGDIMIMSEDQAARWLEHVKNGRGDGGVLDKATPLSVISYNLIARIFSRSHLGGPVEASDGIRNPFCLGVASPNAQSSVREAYQNPYALTDTPRPMSHELRTATLPAINAGKQATVSDSGYESQKATQEQPATGSSQAQARKRPASPSDLTTHQYVGDLVYTDTEGVIPYPDSIDMSKFVSWDGYDEDSLPISYDGLN